MSDEDENIIGAFNNIIGIQMMLRDRREELGISFAALNAMCGFAEGHAEKLLSDPPKKNMGIGAFSKLMDKLCVTGLLLGDQDKLKKRAHLMSPRLMRAVRTHETIEVRISKRTLKKLAIMGGHARAAKMTKRDRSRSARIAARARWHGTRPVASSNV